ncbi:MAG: M14 family zinc carboxypeptidase [Acidobacteriota bacterium]
MPRRKVPSRRPQRPSAPRIRFGTAVCALALLGTVAFEASPSAADGSSWDTASEAGPWVVRVELPHRQAAQDLSTRIDVWSLSHVDGHLVAMVTEEERRQLEAEGFALTLEEEHTRTLRRLGTPLEGQGGGIPGFPCYRTVEETFATAEGLAQSRPDLATWIDIGDSWRKTQDPAAGYDLRVLKLTRGSIPGPKPVFFASFAIHAREYTTAELGTRFAERLVADYGVDPDVTWLLDHHEIHLLLQANPDGRKRAETGILWRKNVNNDYCGNTNSRGADLNRNFAFRWNCCGGSSGDPCSDAYRGALAASEPEIQAHQAYVASIFPDQRPDALDAPVDPGATGVAIDVHSFGELVLWPWGLTTQTAPDHVALRTLGRKLAFWNDYRPIKVTDLVLADGGSADFYYGELGVAGFGFELGTTFFQGCTTFEADIVPGNLEALLYGAKAARSPYTSPSGPEALGAAVAAVRGDGSVLLTATLDDTRSSTANGIEPSQAITSAEAFVATPPWAPGAVPVAMAASDGTFDGAVEAVEVLLDVSQLPVGRHLLYVRGTDASGTTGIVDAVFLDVELEPLIFADGFEAGNLDAWSGP